MGLALDAARIDEVVTGLLARLHGDWLLIGGALVALWLEPRRVTEDVDVVGLGATPDGRLALLTAASDLGLPVEAVNSAADFFVRRVPGWEREIEPFRHSATARLFRPTPTLFLLLKAGRLSARDLLDCEALLAKADREGLAVDRPRVLAWLAALPATDDPDLRERRLRLIEAVQPRSPR